MSDEHPSAVSGTLNRPFTEQVAFFRRKLGNLVPTSAWDDMLREAHDDGFMVAGAAKADLLADLAAAVDKAITEGRGIEDFRRDFDAIVRRHGWTGWTGQGTVQGEAWRVKTILRTNSYTSYAAGRMAQLRAGKFPFWVYRHGGSEHPRLHHLALDGLVLPSDHPAWAKLYPPSDWGCSCYVVGASSERAARRLGGDLTKTLPADWERHIGKGWDYAPGASVSDAVAGMAGKIAKWDHRIATAFLEDLPAERADAISDAYRALPSTADDMRRYAKRVFNRTEAGTEDMGPLPSVRTLGMARSDHASRINAALGSEAVDGKGFDFSLDVQFARHIRSKHGPGSKDDTPLDPADFAVLPQLVSDPDEIRRGDFDEGDLPSVVLRKAVGGNVYEAVFVVRGGKHSLVLQTFYIARRAR